MKTNSEKHPLIDILGLPPNQLSASIPPGTSTHEMGYGFTRPEMRVGLLCTARSGSSLLSVRLQAYGFQLEEYLNQGGRFGQLIKHEDVSTLAKLAEAFEKEATVNDRLATKLSPGNIPLLFWMGEFPKNFDKWRFIHIERRNLVRQAISSFVAQRTGLWTSTMKAVGEVTPDDYDFHDILHRVNTFANGNRFLRRLSGLFGLEVMHVTYEDYALDQTASTRKIAEFLGIDPKDHPDASKFEPWIERQSTGLNDEWEQRFLEDLSKYSVAVKS